MKKPSSTLTSIPFVLLYISAGAAIVLNMERGSWGSAAWFPYAVGLVAATVIVVLRRLLKRFLTTRRVHNWHRTIFFAFCSLLPGAGAPFLAADDPLLAAGLSLVSAVFLWAALGTAFQWPGFRDPPKPNECRRCRYDLTGNQSGVCPECGTAITTTSVAERS